MNIFGIIPTCDDLMSIYTLCGFMLYSGVLIVIGRVGYVRMNKIDEDADATLKTVNEMRIDMAVMKESIQNIERDGIETRGLISEINKTLMSKALDRRQP